MFVLVLDIGANFITSNGKLVFVVVFYPGVKLFLVTYLLRIVQQEQTGHTGMGAVQAWTAGLL